MWCCDVVLCDGKRCMFWSYVFVYVSVLARLLILSAIKFIYYYILPTIAGMKISSASSRMLKKRQLMWSCRICKYTFRVIFLLKLERQKRKEKGEKNSAKKRVKRKKKNIKNEDLVKDTQYSHTYTHMRKHETHSYIQWCGSSGY